MQLKHIILLGSATQSLGWMLNNPDFENPDAVDDGKVTLTLSLIEGVKTVTLDAREAKGGNGMTKTTAPPSATAGSGWSDNYKVPYPTEAVDTCVSLLDCTTDAKDIDDEDDAAEKRALSARGAMQKRRDPIKAFDGQFSLDAASYYKPYEFYTGARAGAAKGVYQFKNNDFKSNEIVNTKTAPTYVMDLVTEHPVELQTIGRFLEWLAASDSKIKDSLTGNWKATTKIADVNKLNLAWAQNMKKPSKGDLTFNDLVFHALGSKANWEANVLADKEVNNVKESLWAKEDPMQARKFDALVSDILEGKRPSSELHSVHRNVLAAFDYMNDTDMKARFQKIFDQVRLVLAAFQPLTGKKITDKSGKAVALDRKFEEFMNDHFKKMENAAQTWVKNTVQQKANNQFQKKINELKALEKTLKAAEGNKDATTLAKHRKDVQDQSTNLSKVLKTLQDKFTKLQTDAKSQLDALRKIEENVSKQTTIKAKSTARTSNKWGDKLEAYAAIRKQVVAAKQEVDAQQRKIDLLYSQRVQQIYNDLDQDMKLFAQRLVDAAKMKMPEFK